MKDYPMEKYKFYVSDKNRKVIAVSTYEGKAVRGVAKADPRDEFDVEKGKQLAAARCAEKIAKRRARRAQKEYARAHQAYFVAEKRFNAMNDYRLDAKVAMSRATAKVEEILSTM